MISIKEVTQKTGVTVRTLRYYDQIDLLKPIGKTDGGHRLYGESEIKRLQHIQFLKTLGFSLSEIKEILNEDDHDWYTALQNQLNFCIEEKKKLENMEAMIRGLMNEYTMNGKNDLTQIQQLIRMYEDNSKQKEQYFQERFSENEQELLDLLPNMNSGDPDTLEWVSLLAQLKKHMNKGIEAAEVQSIVRRILEKEKETFGEDPKFPDKIWEVRKSQVESKKAGFYPIDPDLIQFIDDATNYYLKGGE